MLKEVNIMRKKSLAFLLIIVMMLSLMGCGQEVSGIFVAGTYEGEGEGINGPIKVAVTVDADKILSIDIKEHSETPGISDPAFDRIPEEIIKQQTVAIDTITGSTITSQGILDAVKAALIAAGATEADITKAASTNETTVGDIIKKSADVIVIGTGGAGMSAAAEVVNAGGTVIVIDKMPSIGGNTILAASAMNAPNPELQQKQEMKATMLTVIKDLAELEPKNDIMAGWQAEIKADIEKYEAEGATYLYDSPALHKLQTYVDGDYVGSPKLIDVFGNKALDSIKWITNLGAKWHKEITSAVGATWQRSHTPTKDLGSAGASFVLPQKKLVEENGGEILLEYEAKELVMEDGVVVGVKGITADGTPFELTGEKGVILATGGFAANPEMREKYNKYWANAGEDVPTTNPVSSTGDGLIMAEAIGANLVGMEWIQMVTFSDSAITAAIENTIQVNQAGERFIKEDGRRDEICQAILEQEGGYMYRIYDAHTIIDILDGISYKGVPIEDYLGKGNYMADSLEELAEEIGVPYDTLQKTVDEFNTYVDKGNDPYGRMLFDKKLERGPYYAVKYMPHFHHTMGGVEINENTQVLDKNGNVIPGLYAAGEVTGGIHGSNRLGGNAITDIITFGRIAGQNVMK